MWLALMAAAPHEGRGLQSGQLLSSSVFPAHCLHAFQPCHEKKTSGASGIVHFTFGPGSWSVFTRHLSRMFCGVVLHPPDISCLLCLLCSTLMALLPACVSQYCLCETIPHVCHCPFGDIGVLMVTCFTKCSMGCGWFCCYKMCNPECSQLGWFGALISGSKVSKYGFYATRLLPSAVGPCSGDSTGQSEKIHVLLHKCSTAHEREGCLLTCDLAPAQ